MRRVAAWILGALILAFAGAAFAAPLPGMPPIEEYGRLPGVEIAALSPSGKRYAVAGGTGEERRLRVVGADGKPITSVNLRAQKVRAIEWAGEDYVLITTTRTESLRIGERTSYEVAHVGILNLAKNKLVFALASGPAEDGVWGKYGVRQIDGRWYGWFGGLTRDGRELQSGYPDLYRVDLETGAAVREADGGGDGVTRRWLLDDAGEILARSEYLREGRWRLYLDKKRILEVSDPLHASAVLGYGRKPGAVLYAVTGETGRALVELSPGAPGNGEQLFPENDEASFELIFDPWSQLLIGTMSEGEKPSYSFFSPIHQLKADAVAKAFEGYRARLVSWSKDFTRAIVFTDGADDSGTYWIMEFAGLKTEAIGKAYPAIPSRAVAPVQMVSYRAADGLEIEGVLTLPPGLEAKNLPVVVMPHGGPQGRDYPGFDWMAQAFASRGYAVFQPNFRGSAGYGAEFVEAGRGEFGRKMQTDLSDGLAWLVEKGIVDPDRACIVGASYGGYAALAGVTLQQGVYKCAVSYSGVSDLVAFARYEGIAGGAETRRYWRDMIGDTTTMRELSPARQAGEASAPILLIHGRDDTVVLHAQSLEMERVLRRAGKAVEMVSLEGEDHWLSKSATRAAMLKAAVEFVERHNPPNFTEEPMEVALIAYPAGSGPSVGKPT